MSDGNNQPVSETQGILDELQILQKGLPGVDQIEIYAKYLATLHSLDKQIIFWKTLALGLLSFIAFNGILIFIIAIKA